MSDEKLKSTMINFLLEHATLDELRACVSSATALAPGDSEDGGVEESKNPFDMPPPLPPRPRSSAAPMGNPFDDPVGNPFEDSALDLAAAAEESDEVIGDIYIKEFLEDDHKFRILYTLNDEWAIADVDADWLLTNFVPNNPRKASLRKNNQIFKPYDVERFYKISCPPNAAEIQRFKNMLNRFNKALNAALEDPSPENIEVMESQNTAIRTFLDTVCNKTEAKRHSDERKEMKGEDRPPRTKDQKVLELKKRREEEKEKKRRKREAEKVQRDAKKEAEREKKRKAKEAARKQKEDKKEADRKAKLDKAAAKRKEKEEKSKKESQKRKIRTSAAEESKRKAWQDMLGKQKEDEAISKLKAEQKQKNKENKEKAKANKKAAAKARAERREREEKIRKDIADQSKGLLEPPRSKIGSILKRAKKQNKKKFRAYV